MKKVLLIVIGFLSGAFLCGCASISRATKSWSSDMNGGLNRTINVYTLDGKLIATYEGKIDIDDNSMVVLCLISMGRHTFTTALLSK